MPSVSPDLDPLRRIAEALASAAGDPIPRGYDLSADGNVNPDSNLRFEVELQRNSTDNNPRFDAGYLRYLV